MKSLLFLFLFILLLGCLNDCLCQVSFQPLKEFGNDTMAYMEKNYDAGLLYRRGKTIGNVLDEAEVPFKCYVLAETLSKYPSIGFVLLFTVPKDEVKALYESGQPVYGVFCDFADDIHQYAQEDVRPLFDILRGLGQTGFITWINLQRRS